ncbi:MAG: pilus assembly PilX N-terminal domain-containing protein [Steroidobacteraceae bacterium]
MLTKPKHPHQSGAALVVGLILLVALTLLALASMNTASLDLIMAGNEQFRSRAFAASEAGIEQADQNRTNYDTSGAVYSGSGTTTTGETYNYSVTLVPGGPYEVPAENSVGTWKASYFTINSSNSTRGTTATHVQEMMFPIMDSTPGGCTDCPGPGL